MSSMYLPPVAPKSPPQTRKPRGSVVVEFGVFEKKNISNVITNPLFEEEYRIDPNDGNAYSQSSFIVEYGGTDEWDAAPKFDKSNSDTVQVLERIPFEEGYRIDPADGLPYSQSEFLETYGGIKEWDSAGASHTFVRIIPEDGLRLDPMDGLAYNQEEFIDKYGGVEEWDEAEKVPELAARPELVKNVFSSMLKALPKKRMESDEEYRVDAKDGDAYTRTEFIHRYGIMLGPEKWDDAKFAPFDIKEKKKEELNPREGDIILIPSQKGSNTIEAKVLKRAGLRIRVAVGEKLQWLQVKEVVKIVHVFANKCSEFIIDVLAVEFGRCKCGLKKFQHEASAIKRKEGLYRESTVSDIDGPPKAAEFLTKVLKDHRLSHDAQRLSKFEYTSTSDDSGATEELGSSALHSKKTEGTSTEEDIDLEEEYRIDPNDGFAYTRKSFVQKYDGSLKEWNNAFLVRDFEEGDSKDGNNSSNDLSSSVTPSATSDNELSDLLSEFNLTDYRMADDGFVYNKEAFIEFYGGTDEWDAAAPCVAADKAKRRESISVTASNFSPKVNPSKLVDELGGLQEEENEDEDDDKPVSSIKDDDKDDEILGEEEYRIDPNDGFAYLRESFVEEYGGTAEWESAQKVGEEKESKAKRRESHAVTRARGESNAGRSYSSAPPPLASIAFVEEGDEEEEDDEEKKKEEEEKEKEAANLGDSSQKIPSMSETASISSTSARPSNRSSGISKLFQNADEPETDPSPTTSPSTTVNKSNRGSGMSMLFPGGEPQLDAMDRSSVVGTSSTSGDSSGIVNKSNRGSGMSMLFPGGEPQLDAMDRSSFAASVDRPSVSSKSSSRISRLFSKSGSQNDDKDIRSSTMDRPSTSSLRISKSGPLSSLFSRSSPRKK